MPKTAGARVGDDGMTPEERSQSKLLVYQYLPVVAYGDLSPN